jgi:uncharacterized protein YecE (DUF72 family)
MSSTGGDDAASRKVSLEPSVEERLAEIARFDFRHVHPSVRFGTASDRYAGWIGQIYDERWSAHVSTRYRKLGKKSYKERTVPTESAADFFSHFSVLEMDFTFYRPLKEDDGSPSSNYHVIERYLEDAPSNASFLVKAPQSICSPFLPGTGRNEDYLNAKKYVEQFQEPLIDLMGDQLRGIIFEQGYRPVRSSPPAPELVEHLDRFFEMVGDSPQIHLEVRSPHLLTPLYFDWLETKGLGFVYSHWTWLPSIKSQWEKSGRFTAADRNAVLRLLTPRKMKYADAYALAYPFDQVVPELSEAFGAKEMIDDSAALAFKAIEQKATIDVIANNRAWGNAPELAAEVARRILEVERRRRQG